VAPRTLPGAGVPILGAVPSRGSITATAPGDAYIAGLGRALSGPGRKKADLLAETKDGLEDATEAMEADGLTRWEAEQQAVADYASWPRWCLDTGPSSDTPKAGGPRCCCASSCWHSLSSGTTDPGPGTSTKTEAGRWRSS
jgi:hypothetical protein